MYTLVHNCYGMQSHGSLAMQEMAKELIPIIIKCIVWGPHLCKHHINLQCNSVNTIN